MKILILGGTKYIGKELYKSLRKKNFDIYTLSRTPNIYKTKSHFVCERKNKKKLNIVLQLLRPNIIVDMINFDDEDSSIITELYNNDQLSFLNHYIVISSFLVYEYFNYKNYKEKELDLKKIKKPPFINYSFKKILMEIQLYNSSLMNLTTIIRFPYVFSHDDYTGRFQKICELAKYEFLDKINEGNKFSMISKSTAVQGIEYVILKSIKGIIDFSNLGSTSNIEIIKFLQSLKIFNKLKEIKQHGQLNFPYQISKDIITFSSKLPIKKSLKSQLKKEAKLYYLI